MTSISAGIRKKAVWGPKRTLVAALLMTIAFATTGFAAPSHEHTHAAPKGHEGRPNSNAKGYRLDKELTTRSKANGLGKTRVIVELQPGAELPPAYRQYARRNGKLGIINGHALELPNRLIAQMAQHPNVFRLHFDRPTKGANYRTALTTGTRVVQKTLGVTGAGVGVAVIDSGITSWHDDLTDRTGSTALPFGNQRVAAFVDFVNGQLTPYDDLGHGTHVAGIIAGNGVDSQGQKAGSAPDATLVSLKVLDSNGAGNISDIIAALDWVLANHIQYNIRVVNMSVGAQIHESYWTDPLTLAAKRVVDAGVVVVAAAGNWGKHIDGTPVWGGIAAPGNAPWVITVGASSTNGTPSRGDDTMATFSSRGPTYLDWGAKPDLVAPGVGTVSLSAPGSNFYNTRPTALVPGRDGSLEYLSLSGTSMAAPVVSGVVAQMLQVNPTLTPNAVKAILEYTAQKYIAYKPLEEGAGFLNAVGAVRLARFYATAQPGQPMPVQKMWSKHIIWGSHRIGGGFLNPAANAFAVGTNWGVAKTDNGDNIIWGADCATAACDNIIWGADAGDNIIWGADVNGDNIIWGTADDDNIVWGTDCGGADCDNIIWGTADPIDNIIWGTAEPGDNIVWSTAGLNVDNIVWGTDVLIDNIIWGTDVLIDNIIWGTDDGDNIIWGADDGDNIIWGSADGDNIIWGNDVGDNIIWGTADPIDNIVWGTVDGDKIVWGTDDGDNIIWGANASLNQVWEVSPDGTRVQLSGAQIFDKLSDRKLLRLIESTVQHVTPPPPPLPPAPTTTTAPTPDPAPTTAPTPDPTTAPTTTAPTPDPTTTTTTTTTTDPTTTTTTTAPTPDPTTTTTAPTTTTTTTTDPTTTNPTAVI
jgi:serine protease AprX